LSQASLKLIQDGDGRHFKDLEISISPHNCCNEILQMKFWIYLKSKKADGCDFQKE